MASHLDDISKSDRRAGRCFIFIECLNDIILEIGHAMDTGIRRIEAIDMLIFRVESFIDESDLFERSVVIIDDFLVEKLGGEIEIRRELISIFLRAVERGSGYGQIVLREREYLHFFAVCQSDGEISSGLLDPIGEEKLGGILGMIALSFRESEIYPCLKSWTVFFAISGLLHEDMEISERECLISLFPTMKLYIAERFSES